MRRIGRVLLGLVIIALGVSLLSKDPDWRLRFDRRLPRDVERYATGVFLLLTGAMLVLMRRSSDSE